LIETPAPSDFLFVVCYTNVLTYLRTYQKWWDDLFANLPRGTGSKSRGTVLVGSLGEGRKDDENYCLYMSLGDRFGATKTAMASNAAYQLSKECLIGSAANVQGCICQGFPGLISFQERDEPPRIVWSQQLPYPDTTLPFSCVYIRILLTLSLVCVLRRTVSTELTPLVSPRRTGSDFGLWSVDAILPEKLGKG